MLSMDGERILFEAHRQGRSRTYEMPTAGGPITPVFLYPSTGSLSRDGRRLAYVDFSRYSVASSVWRVDLARAGGPVLARRQLFGPPETYRARSFRPTFCMWPIRAARGQIVVHEAAGEDAVKMTSFSEGFAGTPRWSPDGKWITFDYHDGVHSQIYVIDAQGRNLRGLTSGNYENSVPSWSRDGSTIYFASNRTGT